MASEMGAGAALVLITVRKLYEENGGWPVDVKSICAKTRLSRSVVHHHLLRLTEKGYLEKGPNPQHGWRPV